MIQVPIDKIIPIEEASADLKTFVEIARKEKTLYILTRNGKPYAAIIDIDYLEHLPELEHTGETKAIHEIGKEEVSKNKVAEEEQQPSEPQTPPPSQQEPQTSDASEKSIKTEDYGTFNKDIGPWKDEDDKEKQEKGKAEEPPDLEIG